MCLILPVLKTSALIYACHFMHSFFYFFLDLCSEDAMDLQLLMMTILCNREAPS